MGRFIIPAVLFCNALGFSSGISDYDSIKNPIKNPIKLPVKEKVKRVDAGELTTVTVTANAYDQRTTEDGCGETGCTASNTRDGSKGGKSRWSCKEELFGDEDENCEITFEFQEPQDIVNLRISFYEATKQTRKLKVILNGDVFTTIESSGTKTGLERFKLRSKDTHTLTLEALGLDRDEWIGIKEVTFMVDPVAANAYDGPSQGDGRV